MSELETNLDLANNYLQKFKDQPTGHFINGKMEFPVGAETYTNTTPTDQSSLGEVVRGTASDVDRACNSAEAAFVEWRDMPGAERKKLLNHFADKIVERAEEIALVESMDCGQGYPFYETSCCTRSCKLSFFC
ncbi:MAG: aldehyde dehydrogenase family protein [Pseudohongiellaceae bacterium]